MHAPRPDGNVAGLQATQFGGETVLETAGTGGEVAGVGHSDLLMPTSQIVKTLLTVLHLAARYLISKKAERLPGLVDANRRRAHAGLCRQRCGAPSRSRQWT